MLMKTIISIIVTVVVLGIIAFGAYLYGQLAISRLNFKFDLSKIDLSNISILNPNPTVVIKTTVDNQNQFSIPFTNLFVKLFHNGKLIAQSPSVDSNRYVVLEKSSLSFDQNLILYVSLDTIQIIKDAISRKEIRIDYEVNVDVFNIKIPTIKDYFKLP